jgi:hypothetical protein
VPPKTSVQHNQQRNKEFPIYNTFVPLGQYTDDQCNVQSHTRC